MLLFLATVEPTKDDRKNIGTNNIHAIAIQIVMSEAKCARLYGSNKKKT